MVIDTLNMKPQAKLQLLSFGSFSVEIKDYTDRNLPVRMNGSEGQGFAISSIRILIWIC